MINVLHKMELYFALVFIESKNQYIQGKFEDMQGVIKSFKSKKERKYNY